MNAQGYRLIIAIANLILVGVIGLLGFLAYRGSPPSRAETPPKTFDPTNYEIATEGMRKSGVNEHRITWSQLDRPKPPPKPIVREPVKPKVPEKPKPQDLSNLFSLVMANYNQRNPGRSSVIVQDKRSKSRQITLAVDDEFEGYTVKDIAVRGSGDGRMAVVTVENRGTRHTIELKRRGDRD